LAAIVGAGRIARTHRRPKNVNDDTSKPHDAPPPREPEIEALGRAARAFLVVLRAAFWLAGAVAIGFGAMRTVHPELSSRGAVWLCVGVPLVLPIGWTFGRGKVPLLVAGVLVWFGAGLLPQNENWTWILRPFASLVAVASLLVWRTLWRLTPEPTARGDARPGVAGGTDGPEHARAPRNGS
jgi:hypothetical protein